MTVSPSPLAGPPGNPLAQSYVDRCIALGEAVPADLIGLLDASYGVHPKQRLDVFRPSEGGADLPVLIFFHGGGFTSGDKAWCRFMAPTICAAPAVLICAGYRLIPDVDVIGQVEDVAAVARWAAEHVGDFGGSPERLFVGGHSAGAALASLMATPPGPLPSGKLKGVYGVSASMNRFAVTGTPGSNYTLEPGPLPVDRGSPLSQAARAELPFVLGWGGKERQVERVERSSMAMIGALCDAGVPVQWMFLPDADHFDTHLVLADPDHPWTLALQRWLTSA